jgi:hypothetical protein
MADEEERLMGGEEEGIQEIHSFLPLPFLPIP